ncbi:MAG TPA: hypothetical protein V6D11_33200 [Waterburya sp.]|jgi:hypothetical protein
MELIQSFISIAETAAKQQAGQLSAASNANTQHQPEPSTIAPERDTEMGPYCLINTFVTSFFYHHQ